MPTSHGGGRSGLHTNEKEDSMTLRVSGKNMDVGDALRGKAEDHFDTVVRKYFDGGYDGHLTLEPDGSASAPIAWCTSIPAPSCRPAPRAATPPRPMS